MITYDKITNAQCDIYIEKYEDIKIKGLNLYVITSIHRCNGKIKIRFGTWEQARQIKNSYKKEEKFKLREKQEK